MNPEQELQLWQAISLGAISSTLHLIFASFTQLFAWRRGHLKQGLLHGLVLGLMGLLTVRALPKLPQPTRALREQIGKVDPESGTAWYIASIAAFLAAGAMFYGLLWYVALAHAIPPTLLAWSASGLIALAIGALLFIKACPYINRLPPLADYDEYPDEPDEADRIKALHDNYWRDRKVEMSHTYAVLAGFFTLVFIIGCVIVLTNDGIKLLPTTLIWCGLVAAFGIAGTVLLSIRSNRIKQAVQAELDELSKNDSESDLIDDEDDEEFEPIEFPPNLPLAFRNYYTELLNDVYTLADSNESLRMLIIIVRYFFGTTGLIALLYYQAAGNAVPLWLLFTLITLGIVAVLASIYLHFVLARNIRFYRRIETIFADADLVLKLAKLDNAMAEIQHPGDSDHTPGPSIVTIDSIPGLYIPASTNYTPNEMFVPSYHNAAKHFILDQIPYTFGIAILSMIYAIAITCFGLECFRSGFSISWFFISVMVLKWLTFLLGKKPSSIVPPTPKLKQQWEYLRSQLDSQLPI